MSAVTAERPAQHGPVRVVLVELDDPLPELTPEPAATPYTSVRLFLLRGGRPVGEVTIPFDGPAVSPDRIRSVVAGVPGISGIAEPARPVSSAAGHPFASVVVASDFARFEMLERCVAAVGAQDYPAYEVVVVDNRRTDLDESQRREQWSALSRVAGVRVVAERRPGVSAARNRGLAEARSDLVAFTDDDTAAAPSWLRSLVDRFTAEPDADCVTGLVIPAELETPAQVWFEASGNAFRPRYSPASFAGDRYNVVDRLDGDRPSSIFAFGAFGTGANMAFRRSALQRLGGFDEALGPGTPARAGEDVAIFIRLLAGGGRLAFEPAAYVRHWHRRALPDLRRQVHGYGVGYTALLTALIIDDPRHAWGLVRAVSRAVAARMGRPMTPTASAAATATGVDGSPVPATVGRVRRIGLFLGPVAYLRGRRTMRGWRR